MTRQRSEVHEARASRSTAGRHPARIRAAAVVTALLLGVVTIGGGGAGPFGAAAATPNLGTVELLDAGIGMIYAPGDIAAAKGYFKQEGLNVNVSVVNSGAGTDAVAALIGGSVQFANTGLTQVIDAVEQGSPLVAIAASTTEFSVGFVISKEAADKAGVTAAAPFPQRLKALKGLRIAISAPGTATDQFTRYVAKLGGLDPDHDMSLITIGGVGAMRAAFKERRIDGFVRSSPEPEAAAIQDNGFILVAQTRGDIPQLRGMLFGSFVTTKAYLAAHPGVVRAFVRGLAKGGKFLAAQSDQANAVFRGLRGGDTPTDIWNAAWTNNYPAMAKDPVISRHSVDVTYQFLQAVLGAAPTVRFDDFVNTSFAEDADASLKTWTP